MTAFNPGTHEDVRAAVETLLDALSGAVGGWTAAAGAPADRSQLTTSGDWGWFVDPIGGEAITWISPAYAVSYAAGAVLGDLPMPNAVNSEIDLYVAKRDDILPPASMNGLSGLLIASHTSGNPTTSHGNPPVTPGTGIVFGVQYEDNYGSTPGATPPNPDLDILDYLGDFVLANPTPIAWPTNPGTGTDGQFYLDTTNLHVYGPRANGAWGAATSKLMPLYAGNYDPTYLTVTAPGGSVFQIAVGDDGTLSTVPA